MEMSGSKETMVMMFCILSEDLTTLFSVKLSMLWRRLAHLLSLTFWQTLTKEVLNKHDFASTPWLSSSHDNQVYQNRGRFVEQFTRWNLILCMLKAMFAVIITKHISIQTLIFFVQLSPGIGSVLKTYTDQERYVTLSWLVIAMSVWTRKVHKRRLKVMS